MHIHGIGLVFARGRGIAALEQALTEGWQPPRPTDVPFSEKPFPLYSVATECLADKTALRDLRRADRLSKMAALAAWDAIHESGAPLPDKSRVGIILATAFGPHVTTFRFLDDILNFGDAGVSPTTFSHSVHNAAASYIATAMELRGPTLTLTQFAFPFHEALRLAGAWLAEGVCEYVLAGAAEECGAVMAGIAAQKLHIAADGRIRPFAFSREPVAVPGEGSAFFLLSRGKPTQGCARFSEIGFDAAPADTPRPDLQVIDADGLMPDESGYAAVLRTDVPAAAYAPLYGSLPTGSAFSCAAAALMLRNQQSYASPVQDAVPGIQAFAATAPAALRRVVCVKRDCQGRTGMISLARR